MENLYEKIGKEQLHELVVQFYNRVFDSPIIGSLFLTDKQTIMTKQEAFLTQFLGGPEFYTSQFGKPRMRQRHLPHAITQEASEEWLRCMKEAIGTLTIEDSLTVALYNCLPALARHMVNS